MENLPYGLSVKTVIRNSDNKILVLQRSGLSDFWPLEWDLPGGKVDPGETFDRAMVREAKEETNLDIRPGSYVGGGQYNLPHVRVISIVMDATVIGGEIKLSDEHEDFKWVSREELADVNFCPLVAQAIAGA